MNYVGKSGINNRDVETNGRDRLLEQAKTICELSVSEYDEYIKILSKNPNKKLLALAEWLEVQRRG